MSTPPATSDDVVMLNRRSYNAARERQRVAEALLKAEVEHSEYVRKWAQDCGTRERETMERCTYLYGLAASLGATEEQLSGASVFPPETQKGTE